MHILTNKKISIYLFSLLFLYEMIGVSIHKQYGFGFFYWPVQEYLLLLLSLISIFVNFSSFSFFYKAGSIYHIYVATIILIIIIYLIGNSEQYASHLNFYEKLKILSETIIWYIISIAMAFNFNILYKNLTIKQLVITYIVILISFFAYVINLNHNNIVRSFIMGANFPSREITIYLTHSGYVKGFHLYFSPLFAIFSIILLYFIKDYKNSVLFISFSSIYVLYLAGGRGSMLSFITAIFLIMTSFRQKIIILLILIFLVLPSSIILKNNNPRFYKLITLDFADDPSARGRLIDLEHNLIYIKNNLFTGGLRSYEEVGSGYIHSSLSILQEYGILVFGIFLFMLIHALKLLYKLRKQKIFILFSMWYIYAVLDMLLFKYTHEVHTMILFVIIYLNIIFYSRKKNES